MAVQKKKVLAGRLVDNPVSAFGVRPGTAQTTPFKPYNPFVVQPPPPGSYDPALDQTLAAAGRGYGDLQDDTQIQAHRLGEDYTTQKTALDTGRQRFDQGLATTADQQQQDYGTQVASLLKNYGDLATSQGERQNASGVLTGGTALQAAAKRAANQQLGQSALDTVLARQAGARWTQAQQAHQDYDTNVAGLNQQYGAPTSGDGSTADSLATGGRAYQDLGLGLSRAGRENTQFGVDTSTTKAYQAANAGYDPLAGKPTNEFLNPVTGASHRLVIKNGMRYEVGPNGQIISSTRRKAA